MKSVRNKTSDWPFDVDLVCRKLGLRHKGPDLTVEVLAQTLRALGYPARGVLRASVGQMQKPTDAGEMTNVYVKEQTQSALVLGDLVMDSGLRRGWEAVLLKAHRNLMPAHFEPSHEWRTDWMVTLESSTDNLSDHSPHLVTQAIALAKQHLTPGWSMEQASHPAMPLDPTGFPLAGAGEFQGDLDLCPSLRTIVFPETQTGTWKLGKVLEEVIVELRRNSLQAEGFVRTTEQLAPGCPNTAMGEQCLFLHFEGHQALTASPFAVDRQYFRTPGEPVEVRAPQVQMLKPNKNNPASPMGVATANLARQLLQVHFHHTLPQAPSPGRKPRM